MNAVLDVSPRLRPMLWEDVPLISSVEQEIYEYPWTEGNFRDSLAAGYSCWVFEAGADLVGYTVMMMVLDEAHLLNIGIARPWQRRGMGRTLLLHALDLARDHGARDMLLEVRPSNIPARRLYAQTGFRQVGERRNYYPAANGRENALLLERTL